MPEAPERRAFPATGRRREGVRGGEARPRTHASRTRPATASPRAAARRKRPLSPRARTSPVYIAVMLKPAST